MELSFYKTNKNRIVPISILIICTLVLTMQSCKGPVESILDNPSVADLATKPISDLTAIGASTGGKFETQYGTNIRAKGVCWGTSQAPSVGGNCTNEGTGFEEYTTLLSDLKPATVYYARAYAVNENSTFYGGQIDFKTLNGPLVEALEPDQLEAFSVRLNGKITGDGYTPVQEQGFCLSIYGQPDSEKCISASSAKVISVEKLLSGQLGSGSLEQRSEELMNNPVELGIDFPTSEGNDKLKKPDLLQQSIDPSSLTRNITGPRQEAKSMLPKSESQLFSVTVSELQPDIRYSFRAYALSGSVSFTSSSRELTTRDGKIELTTGQVSSITATSAIIDGIVTSDGGALVTARGICYATTINPTTTGTCVSSGSGTGTFSATLPDLAIATTYYVRAYATNSVETSYGNQINVSTLAVLPTVTTGSTSFIGPTSATVGGTVTSDGGSDQTTRGICYATTENPTTANTCVAAGAGEGTFETALSGLEMGTIYYARAYATNSIGTTYGSQVSFTTLTGPTVTTGAISNITSTSTMVAGNVTLDGGSPVTDRGVCYSTAQNPTTSGTCVKSGSGIGSFSANLTGLEIGTTYYVRAYATNSVTTSFGSQSSFTTLAPPTMTTRTISNITSSGALVVGNIAADGGTPVTARGVCYSTAENPTTSGTCVASGSGTGEFSANLTGLSQGTTYYARAYGINSIGTSYGSQISFTTLTVPTVATGTVSSVTSIGAVVAGNATTDGGTPVTARGICYSTAENPTTSDTCVASGSGTGEFSATITGLSPGITYYVRAYSTNSIGTSYGAQASFTTLTTPPSVTTGSVSLISSTSATLEGNATEDGGTPVTARGICYSTAENPTTSDTCVASGSGMGEFSANLTGLSQGTTYYARAYATNAVATGYGSQVSLITHDVPSVTAGAISAITSSSATVAGNVTSEGGVAVTARGVCYSTQLDPTTDDSCFASGSGTGTFSTTLTKLAFGTTYFARAYATNEVGTTYAEQREFTTRDGVAMLTTTMPTDITTTTAQSGGEIIDGGGAEITSRGVVWSTAQNPTLQTNDGFTQTGTGIGSFTSSITGLSWQTTYYVRAYATNEVGTTYAEQREFTTTDGRDNSTTIVEVTSRTGRVWMDRNLGATRAASTSNDTQGYGDLYQWGRAGGGHQKRNSATTGTLSTVDQPTHGMFIVAPDSPYDWRSPQNNSLWQGVNGINNPCPDGYRVPTEAEWNAERLSWSSNNSAGAYASPIKLPLAGYRVFSSGSLLDAGFEGRYWSGTVSGNNASLLSFNNSSGLISSEGRAYGFSIRCLKGSDFTLAGLTTIAPTNITATTAQSGGEITIGGGAEITSHGVVWSTAQNPTLQVNDGFTQSGTGIGSFTSAITGLSWHSTYYVRSYATNEVGTAYGEQREFTTRDGVATLTTIVPTEIYSVTAVSGGEITDDGGANITSRGLVWSTSQNPTLQQNVGFFVQTQGVGQFFSSVPGIGSFSTRFSGLNLQTTYYVRSYATNMITTTYGEQKEFTTTDGRDNTTEIVEVTSARGRVWMDRDLGSVSVETLGDLYQWGRAADGHQKRNSSPWGQLSSVDQPSHSSFISRQLSLIIAYPNDWRSPQNNNLWQGVNGINNPCPDGYRVPTGAEWDVELASWGSANNPLKLIKGGYRLRNGEIGSVARRGNYWSSSVSGYRASILELGGVRAYAQRRSSDRVYGSSVRCIKD